MEDKSTRREFLKKAIIGGVALGGGIAGLKLPSTASAETSAPTDIGKSRLVCVTSPRVLSADGSIAGKAAEKMLDQAMVKLAGTETPAGAWLKYFKPDDVVGVKINCLFGKGVSTHPEVVDAVVAGLVSAGVKPQNIIVWDRSTNDLIKSGFSPNRDGEGVRYLANDKEWGDEVELGSFRGKLTKILTEDITALINMPILKTHGITGISGALKNHYGSFHNPGDYHGGGGSPYLADINAVPAIKDKTRLVVVDAIRPLADGGPGLRNADMLWDYNSIMVTTDPVAADYVGWQVIEARRKELEMSPLDQPAKWLRAATARGLGNSDPSKIDVIRI